ncbi:hypothetical protein BDF20DRAFT_914045 [Mycotypha africana]|uniref:uncharacterized protein n=1 Tax=Mycotypha africana TaxID=64632 RepID=UPI0023005C12|nr:uncharacterized protein BDF20DRAFT_914045 [Mycotypha africana]KAI8975063.1 hypothetical protein BDF20DRAFT_914045 [Mycotypha africana]
MVDRVKGTAVRNIKYDNFVHWLRDNDFPEPKLTLANFTNTGRGMMATDDIEAGEVILSVPKKFLITNESLSKLYGVKHGLSSQQLLALHLLLLKKRQDKSEESWWKYYIDLLPVHFDTMPVKYNQHLIEHLPQSLRLEVEQQKANIQRDYIACVDFLKSRHSQLPVQTPTTIESEEYEWAWLCVNTRCIHMTRKNNRLDKGNIALAPMLDFLNHTTEAKVSLQKDTFISCITSERQRNILPYQIQSEFNAKKQSFEIKTLTPYRKGEQVFINYGPHDNLALLKEYGFVIPENNCYNFVQLDHEIWNLYNEVEPTKRGITIKKEILEGSGYYGDYTITEDEISFRLLAALRLLAINGTTEPGFDRKVMDWHDVVMGQAEMISTENERKALVMLRTVCEKLSKQADTELSILTTFNEDFPDIESHPFALFFVRHLWNEAKDILRHALMYITEKLAEL